MRDKMNKKGEGSNFGYIFALVVGIIVVALVLMWFMGVFDTIDFARFVPGQDLEKLTQGCILASQGGLKTSYCAFVDNVKIDGVKQYANCQFVESKFDASVVKLTCDQTTSVLAGNAYCGTLFAQDKVKTTTRANGVLCSSLNCAALGGEEATTCVGATNGKTKAVSTGFVASTAGKVCCVVP